MSFSIGLAFLVSAAFGSAAAAGEAKLVVPHAYLPQAQTVREYVEEYFADVPVMASISYCESKFRQYGKNGEVLRGHVREDVGVMQINEYFHGKTAKALEIDLYTIEGNVEYARYLYEREGTTPWLSSSKCWKPRIENERLAVNEK